MNYYHYSKKTELMLGFLLLNGKGQTLSSRTSTTSGFLIGVIERYAFDGTSITCLEIPEGIERLNLKDSDLITDLMILDSRRIKPNNEYFRIPPYVKKIIVKEDAFQGSKLKEFVVPNSVKVLRIEHDAFKDAKYLKKFILPKTLEKLTIGDTLINVKKLALEDSRQLKKSLGRCGIDLQSPLLTIAFY